MQRAPRVRRPTARAAEAEAADRASLRTWASDDDKDIGFFRRADHETEFSAIARILNEQGIFTARGHAGEKIFSHYDVRLRWLGVVQLDQNAPR